MQFLFDMGFQELSNQDLSKWKAYILGLGVYTGVKGLGL